MRAKYRYSGRLAYAVGGMFYSVVANRRQPDWGRERRGRGVPSTGEEDDDRIEDGTGDTQASLDTRDMTVGLPQRKLEDLRQRLKTSTPRRREAIVREVLSLAGKLHHAAYVAQRGRYFLYSVLRLANLYITGDELRGGGEAWCRLREKSEFVTDIAGGDGS